MKIIARQAKRWEQTDLMALRRVYGSQRDNTLAATFDCSEREIARQAASLALSKNKGAPHFKGTKKMPRWTLDEVALLCMRYPDASNLDLALELGHSVKSIVSKAHRLGLRKSVLRLVAMGKENVAWRYREG